MSDPAAPPSEAEMALLKHLWRDGDLSAREVQARVAGELDWTVSTTRTVLERMRGKGLVDRREVHGVAVYSPRQPKVAVIGQMMRRLGALLEVDGPLPVAAFAGSQILDDGDIAALEAELNRPADADEAAPGAGPDTGRKPASETGA